MTESKRSILLNALGEASQVSLTLDIWTDQSCHSYLAITVHTFIRCNSVSGLLTFAHFKGSHTGAPIAEEIDKSICDNNLQNKITYTVTD